MTPLPSPGLLNELPRTSHLQQHPTPRTAPRPARTPLHQDETAQEPSGLCRAPARPSGSELHREQTPEAAKPRRTLAASPSHLPMAPATLASLPQHWSHGSQSSFRLQPNVTYREVTPDPQTAHPKHFLPHGPAILFTGHWHSPLKVMCFGVSH